MINKGKETTSEFNEKKGSHHLSTEKFLVVMVKINKPRKSYKYNYD